MERKKKTRSEQSEKVGKGRSKGKVKGRRTEATPTFDVVTLHQIEFCPMLSS